VAPVVVTLAERPDLDRPLGSLWVALAPLFLAAIYLPIFKVVTLVK
jgi:ABC-type polysaccharide/polyol phosphate export permease